MSTNHQRLQSLSYERSTGRLTIWVDGGRYETVLDTDRDCVEFGMKVKVEENRATGLTITITAETFGPSPGTDEIYSYSIEPGTPQAEEVEVQV